MPTRNIRTLGITLKAYHIFGPTKTFHIFETIQVFSSYNLNTIIQIIAKMKFLIIICFS